MSISRINSGWTELKGQAKPHEEHLDIQSDDRNDALHGEVTEAQKTFSEIKVLADSQLSELQVLLKNIVDIRHVIYHPSYSQKLDVI